MPRKQSPMQKIISFGLGASSEGLDSAIEALQVIRADRFPKAASKPSRKPRTDKGTRRTPPPPATDPPANGE